MWPSGQVAAIRPERANSGPADTFMPRLDRVRPDMAAFYEETFGPVAAIIRVPDAATAVQLANQSEFGLGASLWSRDIAGTRRIARQLDVGAVFVNAMMASDPRLPFGGPRDFTGPRRAPVAPAKAAPPLSAILKPVELDPLTVADDGMFLERIEAQPNVPAPLKNSLRGLY